MLAGIGRAWDNGGEMCEPEERPSFRSVVNNCMQPMPLRRKLTLMVFNNLLKLRRVSSCCGHPGQPGC